MKKCYICLLFILLFVSCGKIESDINLSIKEEGKNIVLFLNEQYEIDYLITEGYEVNISSLDENIATIENEKVTAIAEGKTKIKLTVKELEYIEKFIDIEVRKKVIDFIPEFIKVQKDSNHDRIIYEYKVLEIEKDKIITFVNNINDIKLIKSDTKGSIDNYIYKIIINNETLYILENEKIVINDNMYSFDAAEIKFITELEYVKNENYKELGFAFLGDDEASVKNVANDDLNKVTDINKFIGNLNKLKYYEALNEVNMNNAIYIVTIDETKIYVIDMTSFVYNSKTYIITTGNFEFIKNIGTNWLPWI